jgi:hypothetical protein
MRGDLLQIQKGDWVDAALDPRSPFQRPKRNTTLRSPIVPPGARIIDIFAGETVCKMRIAQVWVLHLTSLELPAGPRGSREPR